MLHILGDFIGLGTAGVTATIGVSTGFALAAGTNHLMQNDPLQSVALFAIPSTLGALLATYIYYKTPQWTDDILLDRDTPRTTKQNLISFLCRILIPVPLLNVVISEAIVHD